MVQIKVPAALTGGSSSDTIEVDASTVGEAFDRHAEAHGNDLRDSVIEDGEVQEFINVYVNGEDVGHLDGLETGVEADDRIRVIPAASGGRR
ncbi:MAG: MoaD/ThiS family protein [Halobacteriaceae archaeon]